MQFKNVDIFVLTNFYKSVCGIAIGGNVRTDRGEAWAVRAIHRRRKFRHANDDNARGVHHAYRRFPEKRRQLAVQRSADRPQKLTSWANAFSNIIGVDVPCWRDNEHHNFGGRAY